MKRKRKANNFFPCFSWHPFICPCLPTHRMLIPVAALLALVGLAPSQTVARPAPPGVSQFAADDAQRKKGAHHEDFLVFGTVFAEQGLVLPGAEIRVRRAGERKVRWEARSDRRGEFAVRVPRGARYVLSVRAAGYREQTQKIDARTGNRADVVLRLSPAPGRKPK